ncbi:hypothetical protein [Diaminobutyricimonas sp. LJ205]|uniref:hypothetical protein n=1 Tax=Diaminobutyricimonas sp. LJ205 TaxID=2683590 RepID=UPI0012F4E60B|nr:hypothetical protein [Diaminobutyricimonas sp. LJ205]
MMTSRAVRAGVALAAGALAVMALTSCAASPKTTYVTDAGETVTVDWADYPGQSNIDSAQVLAAPATEDVEEASLQLLAEIETALTEEFGLEWEVGPPSEATWWEHDDNGYGGDSLYVGYLSLMRQSTPCHPATRRGSGCSTSSTR